MTQEGCGGSVVHIVENQHFRIGDGFLHIPIYVHSSYVGGEVQRDLIVSPVLVE